MTRTPIPWGLAALVLASCHPPAPATPRVMAPRAVAPAMALSRADLLRALPLPPATIPPPAPRASAPPPLFGGTLTITHDHTRAVVSDPDGDRVFVVDLLDPFDVVATLLLDEGATPGPSVEDATGRVHVLLRGSGQVVAVDPQAGTLGDARAACDAPRGLTVEPRADGSSRLLVACGGGDLVALDLVALNRAEATVLDDLGPDLRDVVVDARGRRYVSRFRTAELIDAATKAAVRPEPVSLDIPRIFQPSTASYAAHVAWRTKAAQDGSVLMLHQRHSERNLDGISYLYYGMNANTPDFSVVKPTLTRFVDGAAQEEISLPSEILPVDLALSATDSGFPLAVAFASSHTVAVVRRGAPVERVGSRFGLRHPVGVAWSGDTLFVQYQDPPALVSFQTRADGEAALGPMLRFGDRRGDAHRGHEIFHLGTMTGVACASCHPEANDDAHTWRFFGHDVRTPVLRGGLSSTAPFHWNGEHASLGALVEAVMRVRMGGPQLEPENVDALGAWLDGQPPLPGVAGDADAVARGRALFEGRTGCALCHGGPRLTDNRSHDVGTGGRFQTPSLLGLRWRAPYLHDGCAPTLEARLDTCHTERHGNLADLDDRERRDLLAYLESL